MFPHRRSTPRRARFLLFVLAAAAGAYVAFNGAIGLAESSDVDGVQFQIDGVLLGAEDTTAPLIIAVVASSITGSTATITWTTDEASDSQVEYGLTTSYGTTSPLNVSLVMAHSVVLAGLTGSTLYHFRVRSRDAAGNLAVSGDITFTTLDPPDVTPPSVSITAPAAGATVSGTVTVSATASDNIAVVGVRFKLDGAALGAEDTTNPYSVSWNTTTVTNGGHTLTAIARDAAGNVTTSVAASVTVTNDATPPVISAVAAGSITAIAATITWTTDEVSDSQVEYGLTTSYGTTSALNESPVTGHSVALSGLTGSTLYHFRVRSRDAAGNLAVSGDATFTTNDATAPTVSITAPSAGATVSGSAVAISATASDNVGVVGVQFKLDGVAVGAEDTTNPYSVSWNTTTATNGSHALTAVARDAAGNVTTSAAVNVTVVNDTTPPVLSAVAAGSITATGAAITWTTDEASDSQIEYGLTTSYGTTSRLNVSLVTAHSVALSGLTGSTLYHFRVRSRDAAGNLAVSGDATFTTLDDTPPTVTITAPTTGTTVSGTLTVSATASDNVGVLGVQFTLDGAPLGAEDTTNPYAVSWNTTTTNGSHTLTAVARDAAGNVATSAGVTATVANADGTPPVISSVAVSAIMSSGATFTWTTDEASDSEVEYGVTTAYGSFSALDPSRITAHTVVVTGLAPSTLYHFRARSRDGAGNLGLSGDFTFSTLEGTPPVVSVTSPADGARVSGTLNVTATATDNVGVAAVQFQLDGAPLGAEAIAAPYAIVWDTTTASDGGMTLRAEARDAAGNRTASTSILVTVANSSGQMTLAWDPNSEPDLAGYQIYLGTTSGMYATHIDAGNITTYTVTGLAAGTTYFFAVTAYNQGGAESGFSNEVSKLIP